MLHRTHRLRRGLVTVATLATTAVVLASCGDKTGPDNHQNALRPAGPQARKILDLTEPFFWIAVVVGVLVVGATIYVALRFRVKPGELPEQGPKQVHGHTALEITWTIIPAIILAVMAVPTIATIFELAKKPTGPGVVNVQVVAKQWWWEYHYKTADGKDDIVTANEMHIPVGRYVSLDLTGPKDGVIHSFWVPALNGKKDVVPGRHSFLKIQADHAGVFLGQCAEYCGLSHANMRLRVVAQSTPDYDAWLARQRQPLTSPAAVDFVKNTMGTKWGCTSCHSLEPDKAGAVAPNLTHVGDRMGFAGDIYAMNFENLWKWVYDAPSRKPMDPLITAMPNFSSKGMTQAEAKQIAKFLLCDTTTDPNVHHPECSS
jgi:cytochrome c oxidase subunit 2